MLALYHHPASSNSLKVRFLLAELGLPYERREVPLSRPRPDWYLALDPRGLLPLLEDDGLRLSESNAILRYLAAREGRDDLYPADLRARARVDEFLDRFATGLRPALFRHEAAALGHRPGPGFGGAPGDHEAARRIGAEIAPELRAFDAIVGERWAVLDRFTIADCAVAPVLFRTAHTGLDLTPYPRLAALRATLTARPAWARAEPVR